MIKSSPLLIKTLQDYLKSQLLLLKKDGCLVSFDGTLMSLINVLLTKELTPFKSRYISCISNTNKFYVVHILSLAKQLNIDLELKDISKDLESSSLIASSTLDYKQEISVRKRFTDLALTLEADSNNLIILGNQSYSQWCIEYPHKVYQNLEHIHLLNRLFYSEIKELGKFFNLPDAILNREPSHFLFQGKVDKDFLEFSYDELEEYQRNVRANRSSLDQLIGRHIRSDNRNRFMCPLIQRPSNILS